MNTSNLASPAITSENEFVSLGFRLANEKSDFRGFTLSLAHFNPEWHQVMSYLESNVSGVFYVSSGYFIKACAIVNLVSVHEDGYSLDGIEIPKDFYLLVAALYKVGYEVIEFYDDIKPISWLKKYEC